MVKIRRFAAHEWRTYQALRLRALIDSPDAFGSTYAREVERPDSLWESRLAAGAASPWDLALMAEVDGQPAGLAWGRIEPDKPQTADLYQLWVAPEWRSYGVGQRLVEAVIAWAVEKQVRSLELDVTTGDSPARRLYTRLGFVASGQPAPLRADADILEQKMRLVLDDGAA